MNRRILVVLLAVLSIAAAWLPGRADAPDVRSLPFSMNQTILSFGSAPEPSIALSSKDHVFICGPLGIPGGNNAYLRSADWTHWDHRNIFDRAGGGDCEIETGIDDAVYTANLQAAASAVRKSTDDGMTFQATATEDPIEQDRQWLAHDPADANIVYLGYHEWGVAAIIVAKSTDGGASFVQHGVASSDPATVVDSQRSTIPGPVRVDPTNHERVYIVWTKPTIAQGIAACMELPNPDAPRPCTTSRRHNEVVVGRSDDGGLTWTDHVVYSAPVGSAIDRLIPWLSVDKAGNLYVAVAGDIAGTNGLFAMTSTDHGDSWSAPSKVNSGSGAVAFPTVAAGANGIADYSWIESSAATHDDTSGVWNVHFAQTRSATSASPTYTQADGPVIHRGDVCTNGILCELGGDRTLLDFMDMELDSFGYAHMVVFQTDGISGILYWRQDAGPSAFSEPCLTSGDPACVTARPGPRP